MSVPLMVLVPAKNQTSWGCGQSYLGGAVSRDAVRTALTPKNALHPGAIGLKYVASRRTRFSGGRGRESSLDPEAGGVALGHAPDRFPRGVVMVRQSVWGLVAWWVGVFSIAV